MIKPDKIILSNRKTISLKIDRKGNLIVYAPKGVDMQKIFNFIQEKEKWITSKQCEIKGTLSLNNDIFNYEQILFLGKKYQVLFIKNLDEIILTDKALCVPAKIGFSNSKLEQSLKKWFINNAEKILIERAKTLLKYIKLSYKSISIINSKAKWGMCDSRGNIFLNYKLIFLSHDLIDYVCLHEITHLIELNHSDKFYEELKRVLPDYKQKQEKLKKCSFLLSLFT